MVARRGHLEHFMGFGVACHHQPGPAAARMVGILVETALRIIAQVDLPADGQGVGVNTATNRVYAGLDGGLAVYDAVTLAPLSYVDLTSVAVGPYVEDVGVDEVRNRIYAVSDGGSYVIDGATGA